PYGVRAPEEVCEFAVEIGDHLAGQGIKMLVVACNTATAAALPCLLGRYQFPVVSVIGPGARSAATISRSGRIGVLATEVTVASGAYTAAILACRRDASVVERAASWLVPVLESGIVREDVVSLGLAPALTDMAARGIDALVLGCTHFPLAHRIIERAVGPGVAIVDSAGTTAREVLRLLRSQALESDGPARNRFLVTGPAEAFAVRALSMFGQAPAIETVNIGRASFGRVRGFVPEAS
ncbi:MAG TPA: glutamate racemase, partial [Chloroflexota bacterium]|nr:glutamate racemase [Chloroflexota bacterium]